MDVLIYKQYKDYDYFSRYVSFPFYYHTEDKKFIYGTTSQIKEDIKYVLHRVATNETIDSIALDYYNNPSFFWAICDFNKIQDPYIKLEVGQTLKIPVLSDISYKEV